MNKDRYYRGVGARVDGYDLFILYKGVYLGELESGGLGYYLRVERGGEIVTKFVEKSSSYSEERALALLRHFLYHIEDDLDSFLTYIYQPGDDPQ